MIVKLDLITSNQVCQSKARAELVESASTYASYGSIVLNALSQHNRHARSSDSHISAHATALTASSSIYALIL